MTNAAAPSDRPVLVDPCGRRPMLLRVAIGVVIGAVASGAVLLATALPDERSEPRTLPPVPELPRPTLVSTSPPPETTTSDGPVPTTEGAPVSTRQPDAPPATTAETTRRKGPRPGPPSKDK